MVYHNTGEAKGANVLDVSSMLRSSTVPPTSHLVTPTSLLLLAPTPQSTIPLDPRPPLHQVDGGLSLHYADASRGPLGGGDGGDDGSDSNEVFFSCLKDDCEVSVKVRW